MKRTLLFILPALLITLTACQSARTQSTNLLAPKAFDQRLRELRDVILVDVRTPEEYAEGHLQGSVNIDWEGDHFEAETAKLDKTKPVFVYCLAGSRSADAAEALRKSGFKSIYNLDGGIEAWEKAGFPVTKP